jgi:hypothetical protein
MDDRLVRLGEDFLHAANEALIALQQVGIDRPASRMDWALSSMPRSGPLGEAGSYRRHGYGCHARMGGVEVDVDFDDHGGIEMPDAWRLIRFWKKSGDSYGFRSEQELRHALTAAP